MRKYNLKAAAGIFRAHLKGKAKAFAESRGLDRLQLVELDNTHLQSALKKLRSDPNVEYAEPNYIVTILLLPDDPDFSKLWGLDNTGQTGGASDADIDAPEAWGVTHDSNIVVGVIDTGVDYTHEDLAANMWKNPGEVENNSIDDDANGFVDDVYGWDFANNDNDPFDDNGHGTHVAGAIGAAGNNSIGVVGVNWRAKIAALKFLDAGGSGTTSDAVRAIQYANMMGFKITSNSWGGGGFSQALYDAIAAANTNGNLFVAAAGNDGVNADILPMYPAAYDLPNIISVAATDDNDMLAGFSNYGPVNVDLGAPGVKIYSTVPKGSCILCDPTGYKNLSGTSMATPHVAGAAALLWSYNAALGHLDVKNRILASADQIASLQGKTVSGGRLNLYSLVEPDTVPPAAVSDLSISDKTHSSITLSWTAVGDDGSVGKAAGYDLRYSKAPIDEANFNSAKPAADEPKPSVAGTAEKFKATGLDQNTKYYFALKVYDNVGNPSAISNVVSATTLQAFTVFSDNMESGVNGWTVSGSDGKGGAALWHQSTRRAGSPVTSWYYGIESTGTYDTGTRNFGSITSPSIDLSGIKGAELVFQHYLATENWLPYDTASVHVSKDSVTWTTLLSKTSTSGVWSKEALDISAFDGAIIKLRFFFDTIDNVYNYYEGWYVDDVSVVGVNTKPQQNITNFTDTFDRLDSTVLGNGWSEVNGDLMIKGNELRNAVSKTYHMAVQPSITGAKQTVAADFAFSTHEGLPRFGLVLRYQNAKNYYLAYRQSGGSSVLRISRFVNGAETVLAKTNIANPAKNTFFRLEAGANGNALTLKLNGVQKLSVSDSTFAAGSLGILMGSNKVHTHRADNFTAVL